MMNRQFTQQNAAASSRFPGAQVECGTRSNSIQLYHAPNSICSQKVRATLFATAQSYSSHLLNIFKGETYDPNYVRLRMMGCKAAGHRLADDHTGETSVTATGCDGCVVPTVVYEDSEEVLVDSLRICIELDRRNPANPGVLFPNDLGDAIKNELSVVDSLPNYQLLAVAVGKPQPGAPDNAFAASKVARCERLVAEHSNDPVLVEAYEAKRSKEHAAANRLFGADAMLRAITAFEIAAGELDQRLADSNGGYLFDDRLTLADLFWGVELVRMDDLGLSTLWQSGKLPRLDQYYSTLCSLDALRHAVIEWPGARLGKRAAA